MAAANTTTELTMKLLINARERRVLYAEASLVVAFLYSLLVSPDNSIMLDDMTWHGCTDSIYDSLEELDDLAAAAATRGGAPSPGGRPPPQQQQPRRFFVCSDRRGARCGEYVAGRSGATCPMDAEAPRGASIVGQTGQACWAGTGTALESTALERPSTWPMPVPC